MMSVPTVFDNMLAAWNERDPQAIRQHLNSAVSENVTFCDPNYAIEGRDAFEAMIRTFRATMAEGQCSRTSGVDGHHHLFRYSWAVHNAGKLIVAGSDVVAVDQAGMICRVDGFFGPIPDIQLP